VPKRLGVRSGPRAGMVPGPGVPLPAADVAGVIYSVPVAAAGQWRVLTLPAAQVGRTVAQRPGTRTVARLTTGRAC
jgi:hypothetical protein